MAEYPPFFNDLRKDERKVDPNRLRKLLSKLKIAASVTLHPIHLGDFETETEFRLELMLKLQSMVEKNSPNLEERNQLLHDVLVCIEIEKRRTNLRKVVHLDRRCSQLKKALECRGLPVDEKSLHLDASRDTFDMSSLTESLPSKSDDNPTKKKAEELAKEYLLLEKSMRQSYILKSELKRINASEKRRINASTAPTLNNSASCSSNYHQSRSITRKMDKSKANPDGHKKWLSKPAQVMHLGEFKTIATLHKEAARKLKSSREEKLRKALHSIVNSNRRCRQLKKGLGSRRLHVDGKSLQLDASRDTFDMSSLTKSLPSKADDNPTKKKAGELAKEYLLLMKRKRWGPYRKSEIIRAHASAAPTLNNNTASGSSKHHQSRSLARMMKEVCGNVENAHIFSFRPLTEKQEDSTDSCVYIDGASYTELKDLDGESWHPDSPLYSKEVSYTLGPLRPPCTKASETNSDKQEGKNEVGLHSNAEKLRNPECFIFNRHQHVSDRRRSLPMQIQELHDSTLHNRLMARLKIANSLRGDLLEGMDESEIQETSTDQNDKQEKVDIANKRREVFERLREKYRKLMQHETEAMKKN